MPCARCGWLCNPLYDSVPQVAIAMMRNVGCIWGERKGGRKRKGHPIYVHAARRMHSYLDSIDWVASIRIPTPKLLCCNEEK